MGTRQHLVDALRGLALLGIVVVNVEFILEHADVGWSQDTSRPDLVVRWLVTTLGALKVYPLFALLFGYGLSMQLDRARQAGGSLAARYRRRMLALVLLGVGHAVLFFPGDILVIYAAAGSLAFLVRGRSSISLLRVAAGVYATASAIWLLLGGVFVVADAELQGTPAAQSMRILSAGSYADVVGQHLSDWPGTLLVLGLIQGPAAYAFILAGIALGRTDVLTDPSAHRALARRVVIVGGPIGLVGAGAGALMAIDGGRFAALGLAIGFAVAPVLSGAYVAALLLVWERLPTAVTTPIRAAGRMSLSIYLLESVVLTTLAYGYGAGLVDSLAPAQAVLLAVGVWAGLCLFAVLWFRVARFGPAEWALRSFSYWRLQPLLERNRGYRS